MRDGSMIGSVSRVRILVGTFLLFAIVPFISGCDLFKQKEKERLEGERIPLLLTELPVEGAYKPISPLPDSVLNESWTHAGGDSANAVGHLTLTHIPDHAVPIAKLEAMSRNLRLSSPPLIYQGTVFLLDVSANLVLISLSDGSMTAIPLHKGEGSSAVSGGGVALDKGILYAATAYGDVYAFDPSSGNFLWHMGLGTPIRSVPTVANDKIFVITRDSRLIVLNALDGQTEWNYRGVEVGDGILGSSAVAVSAGVAVVPYSSGELIAFDIDKKEPIWSETLFRANRLGRYGRIADIVARPVIYEGVVYAVSVSGRMLALDLRTGNIIWSRDIAASQTPVVAGQSIYLLDVDRRLVALDRMSGDIHWVSELRSETNAHWSGPILGGGRLWVVSSDGFVANVDAISGEVISRIQSSGELYISPIIAGGRIYTLTGSGVLEVLE